MIASFVAFYGQGQMECEEVFFVCCVDALRPSQQFFSHVGTISCLPLCSLRMKSLARGHKAEPRRLQ